MKGVLLLVAALICGALLTSCGKAGSRTGAKPTTGSTSAAAPRSEKLVTGQVVKLRAGVISAQLRGTEVTFSPFGGLGWYGFQADETGFVVGNRPGGLKQRTQADFGFGVNRIELPIEQAALQLQRTPGVRVSSVDKGDLFGWDSVPYPRLGGHPAHLYRLLLSRPKLHEIFGIPAQSFSRVGAPQRGALERRVDVVLVGAGGKTFLVRFGNHAAGLDPAYHNLMSLNFSRWSDQIVPPFGVSKADVYRRSQQFCSGSHPEEAARVAVAHAYARWNYRSVLKQPAFEGCLQALD